MPLKTKSAPKEHLGLTTRQKMKKYRAFYIMFIPLFLCLILFSYLPMFGILYAFTDYTPFKPAQFVGLQNFQKLFSQAGFWKAFFNTLQISITKLVIDTLGSIVLALLLDELHCLPVDWRHPSCKAAPHDPRGNVRGIAQASGAWWKLHQGNHGAEVP